MKTHFFLKALAEGDPDGCGKKVHMDFGMDFGFSLDEEYDQCEDLATHFSNFLHSLGYEGSFKFVDPRPLILSGGNPSMAYNPDDDDVDTDPPNEYTTDDNGCRYKWNEDEGVYIPCDDPSDDEVTLNKLRQPNPDKEGTNGK